MKAAAVFYSSKMLLWMTVVMIAPGKGKTFKITSFSPHPGAQGSDSLI